MHHPLPKKWWACQPIHVFTLHVRLHYKTYFLFFLNMMMSVKDLYSLLFSLMVDLFTKVLNHIKCSSMILFRWSHNFSHYESGIFQTVSHLCHISCFHNHISEWGNHCNVACRWSWSTNHHDCGKQQPWQCLPAW